MSYWSNKRKREAEKGKPVKTSSEHRVEFRIDDKHYVYVYRTTSNTGLAYVYEGQDEIYGPNQSTAEGRRVYELLQASSILK